MIDSSSGAACFSRDSSPATSRDKRSRTCVSCGMTSLRIRVASSLSASVANPSRSLSAISSARKYVAFDKSMRSSAPSASGNSFNSERANVSTSRRWVESVESASILVYKRASSFAASARSSGFAVASFCRRWAAKTSVSPRSAMYASTVSPASSSMGSIATCAKPARAVSNITAHATKLHRSIVVRLGIIARLPANLHSPSSSLPRCALRAGHPTRVPGGRESLIRASQACFVLQ